MPMHKPALAFLFMNTESFFKIGWIVKPHGLKGEVTVMLEEDAPNDFSSIKSVFIEQDGRLIPYFIQHLSAQGKKAFIKFEDVNSPEDAGRISKQSFYLSKSLRPKAAPGQFYPDEVIAFEVHDQERGLLGKISEVVQAGPNRLLVLHYQGKEVLIPVNAPFITSVNMGRRKIKVELPEGFLDL
jgi:16S rRNA processing protein RimM